MENQEGANAPIINEHWTENAPTISPAEWARKLKKTRTREEAAPAHMPDGAEPCLLWGGYATPDGYGRLNVIRPDGRRGTAFTHVLAFLSAGGIRQGGAEVRHLCGRGLCCRPSHLMLGSRDENEADKRTAAKPKPPYVVDVIAERSVAAVAEERRGMFVRLHDGRWLPEEAVRVRRL